MRQAKQANQYDHWDALERTINETEVLEAIYGGIDPEQEGLDMSSSTTMSSSSSFRILSPSRKKMECIKRIFGLVPEDDGSISALDNYSDDGDDGIPKKSSLEPPDLQIEIRTHIEPETKTTTMTTAAAAANIAIGEVGGNQNHSLIGIVLRCLLPRGYPEYSPAVVTSIQIKSIPSLNRSSIDEITRALNERARNLIGTEAIMEIVEQMKELARSKHRQQEQQEKRKPKENQKNRRNNDTGKVPSSSFGRRWIWVHHITSKDRIKSIRAEAERLNLKGVLKHGYPGVILVDGRSEDCNTFVKWIKGDKSSPMGGGFGRNWGHHVRGEIDYGIDGYNDKGVDASSAISNTQQAGLTTLKETEDLSVMANYCKDASLEDEFREFVLKHK